VAIVRRECAHGGCPNVITNFAYPKGEDPRTVRAHGSTRIKDFTPLMAQRWVVQHPGTKKVVSQMFAKAAKAGLVAFNVFDRTEAPAVHREPRMPPTAQQLNALVTVARGYGGWWGEHLADLIVFTAFSGLRLKEVAGVLASDVLDDGRLVVRAGKRGPGEAVPRVRTVGVFGPGRGALLRQKPHVGRVWSWRTPDRARSGSVRSSATRRWCCCRWRWRSRRAGRRSTRCTLATTWVRSRRSGR
jgi:hypothetical protein